jgi:hypothetical protein
MRKLLIGFSSLLISLLCSQSQAQQPGPQSAAEAGSCDSLGHIVSDDVKRAASSLNVCHNLEHILVHRGITSSRSFENFVAEMQTETGTNPKALPQQDEATKQQDLRDRQQITQALNRATMDTNLVLLRSNTALLELQASTMNAEQRAYRRTKILNAFLGTTVGVIGSGMQFSNSTSVQHAGDGVSVAGGAITAVFAMCTADINVIDQPPDEPLAKAFQNDNQHHVFPDTVWSFLKSDGDFNDLVQSAPQPQPHPTKALSCHWKQPPKKSLAMNVQFFDLLENSLVKMSQATAELSRVAALE